MIQNTDIAENTGLQSVFAIIDAHWSTLFGHVARLHDLVPTHCTLRLATDVRLGTPPSHRPGNDLAAALVTRGSNHSYTPILNIPINERWDESG